MSYCSIVGKRIMECPASRGQHVRIVCEDFGGAKYFPSFSVLLRGARIISMIVRIRFLFVERFLFVDQICVRFLENYVSFANSKNVVLLRSQSQKDPKNHVVF